MRNTLTLSHNKHIVDNKNKDVGFMDASSALEHYSDLAGNWIDPYPKPVIDVYDGISVVRDDLLTGSKVRGADCLISKLILQHPDIDTLVYVQPRFGLAGVSILDVAKRYGLKVKLFMPASKRISHHQASCIEQGADVEFHRIAAMPNLNLIAEKWASQRDNAFFIPLGLKHRLVTAGFVHVARQIPEPEEVWTVVSTGVLHRSLQIAWPNAHFNAVAVARNMKAGEVGHDRIHSHPLAFTKGIKEDEMPPFPSMATYDAKCWKYIPKNSGKYTLFWNVGTEPPLHDISLLDSVDSYKDWPKNA
jgi:hypothetical protein|tara:strand:- start:1285 stop:2196 length:912 start_codon:yes stop_codon:yes gene_type:complete